MHLNTIASHLNLYNRCRQNHYRTCFTDNNVQCGEAGRKDDDRPHKNGKPGQAEATEHDHDYVENEHKDKNDQALQEAEEQQQLHSNAAIHLLELASAAETLVGPHIPSATSHRATTPDCPASPDPEPDEIVSVGPPCMIGYATSWLQMAGGNNRSNATEADAPDAQVQEAEAGASIAQPMQEEDLIYLIDPDDLEVARTFGQQPSPYAVQPRSPTPRPPNDGPFEPLHPRAIGPTKEKKSFL